MSLLELAESYCYKPANPFTERRTTMKSLDLTAEVTALRDRAIQPRELGELFAIADGMPEHFQSLFKQCNSYSKIYDVLNALEDNDIITLHYIK